MRQQKVIYSIDQSKKLFYISFYFYDLAIGG